MNEVIDAEPRRHAQLVSALIEPHSAEVHIVRLLSRWLSDREVGYLVAWIGRAHNELTVCYRDLIARACLLKAADELERINTRNPRNPWVRVCERELAARRL
jgi:hypothetical protein